MVKENWAKFERQWRKLDKKKVLGVAVVVLGLIGASIYAFQQSASSNELAASAKQKVDLNSFNIEKPVVKYGFITNYYKAVEGKVQANDFLSTILQNHGVGYSEVDRLVQKSKDVFSPTLFRPNDDYLVLKDKETDKAQYFILEPNAYKYIVYDLTDTMNVYEVKRKIDYEEKSSSGVIESSLWNAMMDNDMSYALAAKMEDALAWSVDFHHIQKNDKFKLIYDKEIIDGKEVGVGKLKAAYFNHYNNDYYAIHFKNEKFDGFYDLEGRPMKKAFLKSPVRYGRISSAFNMNRFHPVLKRRRPHLGTDYAAPYGTPILAVADGTVTKRSRTRGNGNFVKLRHDKVYDTQYLHMQKFAKDVKVGTRVKQGQVIGYVGSTGLATGPHVCFRFWKNGKQINHRKEKLPPPEPLPQSDLAAFESVKNSYKDMLDSIHFTTKTVTE